MPGPLVRALIAHVDSSFEGPNGDYPALLETITGLTDFPLLGAATPWMWLPGSRRPRAFPSAHTAASR